MQYCWGKGRLLEDLLQLLDLALEGFDRPISSQSWTLTLEEFGFSLKSTFNVVMVP